MVEPKSNNQKQQPKPSNAIDLQSITTFPHISSDYVSVDLKNKFRFYSYVLDKQGEHVLNEDGSPKLQLVKDYWGVMDIFTQDLRLSNMNKEESVYVRYHLNLCSDILTALPKSFCQCAVISLQRATTVNETSQGKNGFLRRMFNTFFSNQSVKEESPTKRSFFGMGKKVKE